LPGALVYGAGDAVQRVDLDGGLIGGPLPVPVVEPSEFKLKAAATPEGVYVAWEGVRNGTVASAGALIDRDGGVTILGPAPTGYQEGATVAVLNGLPVFAAASSNHLQAARPSAPSSTLLDVVIG